MVSIVKLKFSDFVEMFKKSVEIGRRHYFLLFVGSLIPGLINLPIIKISDNSTKLACLALSFFVSLWLYSGQIAIVQRVIESLSKPLRM